jgi:hypothetical protein
VYNYDVLQIKGEHRSAQAGGRSSMWVLRSISTIESFKGRIPIMDRVLIYGYVCIGLVGSSLIGMIVFAWIVLAKLRRVPQRWVDSDNLT